jgi:hypothetical protein
MHIMVYYILECCALQCIRYYNKLRVRIKGGSRDRKTETVSLKSLPRLVEESVHDSLSLVSVTIRCY